jgi:hypothetical protein
MPACLSGESRDTGRGQAPEQVLDAHGGSGVAACLVTQGRDRMSRVEVKLVEKEVVRMHDSNVLRRCRRIREVANVERDQDRGIAADGRGQHVAVFRVTGHRLYEALVSADFGIGEGPKKRKRLPGEPSACGG